MEDGEAVRKHQPLCVVETTKASVEIESPGAGTLVQLFEAGAEVELGRAVALLAESAEELARLLAERDRGKPAPAEPGARKATRKAVELAELHGIDLTSIEKEGFITAEDVAALVSRPAAAVPAAAGVLAGVSTEGVTLPAAFHEDESVGALDREFLESLRSDPDSFRALPSDERVAAYRRAGAQVGEGVELGEGTLVDSPRILVGEGVVIGRGATVRCAEVVAVGALTHFGPNLEITCRRAFIGAGVHGGRSVRMGGGGHRDPWAVVAIGDLTFLGDEIFVNVCRPVLIGSEVFLTQRAMLVTHNIGHSVLEGFENRFAPVVLEDRSQVGLGTVVYAGCRVGREAIVASGSYVVSDIPPGKLAIGVPAKVAGAARRALSRPQQLELAGRMLDELEELLSLRGHAVSALPGDLRGLELETGGGRSIVLFLERLDDSSELPPAPESGEAVVLTLDYAAGSPPDGYAVLDLLGRTLHGEGGVVLDSVREFCRKRGIRFDPGPWRYRSGLI